MTNDDNFLSYLRKLQYSYQEIGKIFGDSTGEISHKAELLSSIISEYEKFVKEQSKDVETLS